MRTIKQESLTIANVKKELGALGISIKKVDDEFIVNFKGGKEATEYYTDDLQDALGTGKAMAKEKKNENKTITLPENIELDMGDRTVILEKGDRIKVVEAETYGRQISGNEINSKEFNKEIASSSIEYVTILNSKYGNITYSSNPLGHGEYVENLQVLLQGNRFSVEGEGFLETFAFREQPDIITKNEGIYGFLYGLYTQFSIFDKDIEVNITLY